MKRLTQGAIAVAALGLSAAAAVALQDENAAAPVSTEAPQEPADPLVTEGDAEPAAPKAAAPRAQTPARRAETATPMAERVATIGFLNKRNGLWRDLKLRPGQATRVGDVIVRLRACEKTAPWEPETMTGAFVQVDVQGTDERWRRVFSGWLFKESPSLNVVEHPIYDVWTKDCAMNHPAIGPETTVLSTPKAGSRGASGERSSAPKSAESPAESAQSNTET